MPWRLLCRLRPCRIAARCHKIVNIPNDLRGPLDAAPAGGTGPIFAVAARRRPLTSIHDNASLYQREAVEIRSTLD
jgi:hypothetical protein